MPKYYVQSGPMATVLNAENERQAAEFAMQKWCDIALTTEQQVLITQLICVNQQGWLGPYHQTDTDVFFKTSEIAQ